MYVPRPRLVDSFFYTTIIFLQLFLHTIIILRVTCNRLTHATWPSVFGGLDLGLDSQKVVLIILKHQTLLEYLHDMNGIQGSRP